jgi:hypothetical protein
MKREACSLLILGALALAARTARADEAQRRALIDAAVGARDAGDHAHALELARSADAVRSTSSLTRFIAEEHEALGHLPEAFDAARRCLRLAEGEEPSANHDAVLVGCRTIAAELRPRVALVSLRPPAAPPPGLVVRVAGVVREGGSEPFAVAAGSIQVEATAPGWSSFTTTVTVAPGEETPVPIALAPLPAPAAPAPVPAPPPAPPPESRRSLLGPIVGAAGVVALGVAGALRLVASSKYDDLKTRCTGGCSDGDAQRGSIEQLDRAAVVTAVGGAWLVGAGVTLFLLDRPRPADKAAAWVDLGATGASVRGRFW